MSNKVFSIDSKFELNEEFLKEFEDKQPNFGPLGYVTYKRTYSRVKPDGSSEEFVDTLKRVVEGTYSIQKTHCKKMRLPWNEKKAQHSAQEMFRRMWDFKFLPPGRGMWMMGADFVEHKGGAALNNCGFVTTKDIDKDFSGPFTWLMDMSCLGVGIGFDTRGAGKLKLSEPELSSEVFTVEDSREGWCDLVKMILDSYVGKSKFFPNVDYSKIRPAGQRIKGFGGVASGPEPLKILAEELVQELNKFIDKEVTSELITDIGNLIGKCVVSGNVRRSAEIVFGNHEDEKFLELKNPDINKDKLYNHRWASNNSIFAKVGMDYSKVAEMTAKNGEPGYQWLDNARAYSRMKDAPDHADEEAEGSNPCISGDTVVYTKNGTYQIKDLEGKMIEVLLDSRMSNNKFSKPALVKKTGRKEVFLLDTKEGLSIKATSDHKFRINGEWKELKDIQIGDVIHVSDRKGGFGKVGDLHTGRILGWWIGDGTTGSSGICLDFWGEDINYCDYFVENVEKLVVNASARAQRYSISARHQRTYDSGIEEKRIASARLYNLFGKKHFEKFGKKHRVPQEVWDGTEDMQRGFLQALFQTDGSPQGTKQKGYSIRLGQSDLDLLQDVQKLLLNFGIFSKIYKFRKEAGQSWLPDSNRKYRFYNTKASHELVIVKTNIIKFDREVGFMEGRKNEKVKTMINSMTKGFYSQNYGCRVESITSAGIEDVYDVINTDTHSFVANGMVVHNCNEQTLFSYELCCLVETFPSRHESLEDWQETLKYAYLYAKTVTLVPTHSEQTNSVLLKNRRIGTSISGIIQAMNKFGKRNFLNMASDGYEKLKKLDKKYSKWLCVPTSIKISSVKPSGSISLLAGTTPGIHFPHSEYYIRRIRFQKGSELLSKLKDCGYTIEDDKYSLNTSVVEFPVKEEYYGRGKDDVSMWEQLEIAAQIQHSWADNQVSVTVTFKKDEAKDIKNALELYESRLKGVSFLPISDHGYEQAPYEKITKEKFEEMNSLIKPISIKNNIHDKEEKFCDGDYCVA